MKFDFKRDKAAAEHLIKARLDPACSHFGYVWEKGNWWEKSIKWCIKRCHLGVRQVGLTKQPELIGSGSIFLPQYDRIFRRKDSVVSEKSSSLGGPIHWIDDRLDSNAGRFASMAELEKVLPKFERAFAERVLPELERYETEDDLLESLLRSDWLTSVKLSATQDTRASLVALMLAAREGPKHATEWAKLEVERIRAEKPLVTSTARYQDLLRTIEHLEKSAESSL